MSAFEVVGMAVPEEQEEKKKITILWPAWCHPFVSD